MSKIVSSQILETCYMNPEAFPWIPWIEGTEIKVLKVNPISGQFITLLKASKGAVIPPHYHHGTVTVYTVQGAWNYAGEEWVAKTGDVIYEPAGSVHQPIMHSEEEVITLTIIDGALEFQDPEGNPLLMLNWTSVLDMYKEYCDVHGVEYIDVTKF